ncbi:MAG: vWA domain-containing protein [Pirellulaceae bacterium]|nr:vWA domain-containing protein [Pirellulaceae bacterium]
MNANLTDITLVVDRSGSMQSIRDDAEGGVNAFIEDQAKEPGEAFLTLVQFDTEYEFLHKGVPISQVSKFSLVPRGSTALLDAVGRAINETGERLAKMNEPNRPGLVIFVVMTDGEENSSQEFTKAQIKKMVEHQQDAYGWHFTFLGADQDAFAEAGAMGIDADGAANFSKDKVAAAYRATGKKVSRMRNQVRVGESAVNAFTVEERDEMY